MTRPLAEDAATGRRMMTGWDAAVIFFAMVVPAMFGMWWALPLTGAAASAALAVWRLVRYTAILLDVLFTWDGDRR